MPPRTTRKGPAGPGGRWRLQDAKARFSEVVRNAQTHGPQRVTLRGRDAAVVLSAEEYARVVKPLTGQALIDALALPELADVEFDRTSFKAPVRDISL